MNTRNLINLVVTEIVFDGEGQQEKIQARAESMINPRHFSTCEDRQGLKKYHALLNKPLPREILDLAKERIKKRLLQQ